MGEGGVGESAGSARAASERGREKRYVNMKLEVLNVILMSRQFEYAPAGVIGEISGLLA